jgi:2,3-bisphosphoglycerate-independent phosphoglycerate mutase
VNLQLYKIIEGGVERGIKKLRVHALADGRDVADGSSVKFFQEIKDKLKEISDSKGIDACIASGGGRMKVTMDRYEVCSCSCLMLSPLIQGFEHT